MKVVYLCILKYNYLCISYINQIRMHDKRIGGNYLNCLEISTVNVLMIYNIFDNKILSKQMYL